jgi:hypothetical protein
MIYGNLKNNSIAVSNIKLPGAKVVDIVEVVRAYSRQTGDYICCEIKNVDDFNAQINHIKFLHARDGRP